MKLRPNIVLPTTYNELLSEKDNDKRWDMLTKYLKQLTIALSDEHRETAKVIAYNDGRVAAGEAEGTSGYFRVLDRFIIQHGYVERTGTGTVDITFPVPFEATNYRVTGTIRGITNAFTGGQAVRFPPGDRTTTGCKISMQSLTDPGFWTAEWIAIGTG
jgi:hypothetical protein